ncbi:MAG: CoA transferase, partial [Sphingobium sp.]
AFDLVDGPLLMAVQSEREWAQFCDGAIGMPELATDPRFAPNARRVENRAALDAIVSGALAGLTRAQAVERLEKAKIAYGQVSTMADLIDHPALAKATCQADDAVVDLIAGAAVVDGVRTGGGVVPALGAHDEALRREFSAGPGAA